MTSHFKVPRIKLKRGSKAYKQLQAEVLARDNYDCQQCGRFCLAPPHHVKKVSQGGDDVIENMVTLCTYCHDKYPNWKEKVYGSRRNNEGNDTKE